MQRGCCLSAGIPLYPAPYTAMVRPGFPPRLPPAIGPIPPLSRPPVPGIRGVPPIASPVIRPLVPIVPPTEKPQTTVYVGKIAPTVENDFLLSILRLCGPVKSWKRAQDPTDGSPRGFGFCEFESAEGVLRALRLLSKFNVDGQELVLNVNQATREYLERYVEKKTEREKKLKESEAEGDEKEHESAPGVEKLDPTKPSVEGSKTVEDESVNKETQDAAQKFGIVTDEDREADRDALEKLTNMMEERLKTKPLPPPPPPVQHPSDGSAKSNSEVPTKSRDVDSDVDIMKSDAAEDKNDDETTSESKAAAEHDRHETSSSSRRYDRRSRERNRERDLKRGKERELERYERERERERVRREREQEIKIREAERLYRERVKEWESREREKEYLRLHEKEREKEKERERWREIMDQEDDSDDDDTRKRRRRSSGFQEWRKKRQREKEDDLADQLREDKEIAEAKRKADEEQERRQHDDSMFVPNGSEKLMTPEEEIKVEGRENVVDQFYESDSGHTNHADDGILRSGTGDELSIGLIAGSDMRQDSAPARKLGFGLVGSGKRTTVLSVFHEEDDEDAEKEKKMRPLVPIDYSTEELQAVQSTVFGTPPNLVAAAEFAKRISNINPKEERSEMGRERNRRSNDRLSQRERDRNEVGSNLARDENREKVHDKILDRDRDREHGADKQKTHGNKKLLDAKQLIDMIPKTKEELFSYDINWAVYDKHELHERMRPWISKKITEFLGEEEATLVDYIVSSTKEHVRASQMLELLQSILDDEAEMFVLKMWRMLIFEIKKVEAGLSLKPKA
ncbi:RNA-binding motif protein 25-like isoform X2 [Tasmannia lanceolata]|uniref:RNA-binding motif protein 25-like isoform X2 n=1 Tax=Tasmannia lanceolata TaxID=3420 RepID=UPI00406318A2